MSGNNSNKKRYFNARRILFLRGLLIIPAILSFIISCSGGSPTVIPAAVTETNPTGQSGSLIPQLTMVYPAGLTGISPSNPGIAIVFSRPMENDLGEMTFYLELRDGATLVPCTISPSVTSAAFSMKPLSSLTPSHVYTVRIYKTCYENDYPTHTLDIINLPTSITASAVTSDYVEYQFTTGTTSFSDTIAPTFGSSTPLTGSTNLPPSLTTGYITFVLNDNASPMIDPSTVNSATVVLYNVTDGATVDGWVELAGLVNFETYYFHPSSSLDYGKSYTLTLSTGSGIKDLSNNVLPAQVISFSTIAASAVTAPTVTSWTLDAITTSTATFSWHTSSQSIAHIEIDTGQTFVSAEQIAHNSSLGVGFSATFSSLAPNTDYSIRISADNDTLKGPLATFDTNVIYNYVLHTPPDTTDGATGNYLISNPASVVSDLVGSQSGLYKSFVAWSTAANCYMQYFDSTAGSPDTWDKWTSGGVNIFAGSGTLDMVNDGVDGAIVTRTSGATAVANRIHDNSGMEKIWVGDITVTNAATSTVRSAITYGALTITTGNASLDYLYDPANSFASISTGDYVINENSNIRTTVTSTPPLTDFMQLSGAIINATSRNYRISSFTANITGNEDAAAAGTTFYSYTGFTVGDIVSNGSSWSYITGFTSPAPPLVNYTSGVATGFALNDTISTYSYKANGTAASNALYDLSNDFVLTTPINGNDIIINTTLTRYGWDYVSSVYAGAANHLLILSNPGKYLFPAADPYQILRIDNDAANVITYGALTSFGASTITQTGIDFIVANVQTGDIIYNPSAATYKFAEITAIGGVGNNTLTLSSQIFTAAGQPYYVMRKKLVSFVWSDATNVYIKSVRRDTGATVFNTQTVIAGTNPYIVPDLNGNALITYQNGGSISIRNVRVGDVSLIGSVTIPGTKYIKKVIPDHNGGAWILYTASVGGAGDSGIAHVTRSCSLYDSGFISNATNADIAVLNASYDAGMVYELPVSVSGDTYSRVVFRAFSYSSGSLANTYVRSALYTSNQLNPRIGIDGSGGAHITWIDTKFMPANPYALFVQHMNNTYTRILADDYCISIPYVSGSSQVSSPYLLDMMPLYYKNGAITPYSGFYFWTDGRVNGRRDLYMQTTPQ